MTKTQEILGLLDRSALENSPVIKGLLDQFKQMLPGHFSKPYFIPAPVNSNLKSVLWANCRNPGCSVRAVFHLTRGDDGRLRIEEKNDF